LLIAHGPWSVCFTAYVGLARAITRYFGGVLRGGAEGNNRLTTLTGVVLLVVLAAEGVTILRIRSLLTPHEFIGMLLIPPVVLKLASTGYRFTSYYGRRPQYLLQGPPQKLLRVLIAPVLVASTLIVFGTGVALLALHQHQGTLVGVHKGAFLVWLGAFALHVLAYVRRIPRIIDQELRNRLPGSALRYSVIVTALALGVLIAVGTMPATDHWRDHNLPHRLDID
jgi:hypothetical protein